MHFSAKRGIAIACRLSVCLSVCLSVTLVDCDHIGWNSSKIISTLVGLGCSLFATPTWHVCSRGNTPKFGPKVTHPLLIWASETFDRKSYYWEPIGSRMWEIDWYQNEWPCPLFRGRIKVTSIVALHLTLNISKTVRDRGLVPKDHQ